MSQRTTKLSLSTSTSSRQTGSWQWNMCWVKISYCAVRGAVSSVYWLVLCDTYDTAILIIDTYVTIPVSRRSRHTAVYRSSKKYRETSQVSRVSTIPYSSSCVYEIWALNVVGHVTIRFNIGISYCWSYVTKPQSAAVFESLG